MLTGMREHLRAMIWPRQTENLPSTATDSAGKPIYRYTIIGMLVTDRPLDVPDEFMVDGSAGGLSYTLEALPKYAPSRPPGDAVDVLCSLNDLLGERM